MVQLIRSMELERHMQEHMVLEPHSKMVQVRHKLARKQRVHRSLDHMARRTKVQHRS